MTRPIRLSILGLLFLGLVAAAVHASTTHRAVIHLSNKVKGRGELVFTFTPTGGEALEITVLVPAKMKNTELARDIMTDFKYEIEGDTYKVGMKDKLKVNIEARKKTDSFELVIKEQSVPGLSVMVNDK